jgi:hypothetical protein
MATTSSMNTGTTVSTDNNRHFSFTINNATDCFCFYGSTGNKAMTYNTQLINSVGSVSPEYIHKELYAEPVSSKNNIVSKNNGVTEFSVPIAENNQSIVMGGAWTGIAKYDANSAIFPSFRFTERITVPGMQPDVYGIKLNLVLYSSTKASAQQVKWIKEALKTVSKVFAEASIMCSFSDVKVLPLPAETITIAFELSPTYDIVTTNAKTDEITVIFAENLSAPKNVAGVYKTVAGRSGGIPGPQGFVNEFAGVLIGIENNANISTSVSAGVLGLTIAHEVGHYLGLTHESSQNSDTNLMFPTLKLRGYSKGILNDQQIFILQRMPIVTVKYTDRELLETDKTPITSLEIAVSTGSRSLLGTSANNNTMVINFQLGSDESDYQTWVLNADNTNSFQPGTTEIFQLDNITTLFMEDLTTWKLNANWNEDMFYPINFQTLTNYWDFKHIKITANNTVIVDADINTILSWIAQDNIAQTFKTN